YWAEQCRTGQRSVVPGRAVPYRAEQCRTGQSSAVLGRAVSYRAEQCRTGQSSAVLGRAVSYRAEQCRTGQSSAVPGRAVSYRAEQCCTGQSSPVLGCCWTLCEQTVSFVKKGKVLSVRVKNLVMGRVREANGFHPECMIKREMERCLNKLSEDDETAFGTDPHGSKYSIMSPLDRQCSIHSPQGICNMTTLR
ncbi:hypothetical protein chiPu_0021499, partial [Chiloscyllium punctatum]|nr:hypothetical protein [Chiloscyllium punctatum]